MSVIIPETLVTAAAGIKDKTLKANAQALVERMSEVIEGVGDRDITWYPSMIKVVQAMSDLEALPEAAKPGKIIHGDDVLDKLSIIPLRIWTDRTYWPEVGTEGKICESPDAKTGWRFGECRTCPHSEWVEGAGVDCSKSVKVLFVTADMSDVCIAPFSKSQYRGGMDFQKLIRGTKTHPYKRMYDFTTAKDKNVYKLGAQFTPRSEYKIEEDVENFIVELFAWAGESRRQQLEFHDEQMAKRAQNGGGGAMAALEHTDADAGTIEVIGSDASMDLDASDDAGAGSVTYEV